MPQTTVTRTIMERKIVGSLFVAVVLVACSSGEKHTDPPAPEKTTVESGGKAESKDVQAFFDAMKGDWHGGYDLWLMPTAPKEHSVSTAQIKADAKDDSLVMEYQWTRGNKRQRGAFHFDGSGTTAGFSWSDTFHSATDPMKGDGKLSDDGKRLVFISSYVAGPGQPAWGWRTEFTIVDSKTLKMEAYNITPGGQEGLAVRCEYARQ